MKKIFKKIGLSLAAVACMACAGVGVSLSSSKSAPEAKAATIAASDFWVSGTGLRLVNDANGAGIRFHTNITMDWADSIEESGTLVIPEVLYDGQLTLDDMNNDKAKRPTQIVTKGINDKGAYVDLWYDYQFEGEDFMRSTVYLYEMTENLYGARMVAVSYVKVDGAYQYTQVSEGWSMTDVANTITEDSEYYAQAQAYKAGDVTVKYLMNNGEVQTETVAYGSKLQGPSYDKNYYELTSATDKWGNAVNFNTYEATLSTNVDVTLAIREKATKITDAVYYHNSTADVRAFEDSKGVLITNSDAIPDGFSSMREYVWFKGSTQQWTPGGNCLYRGMFNQTDISGYYKVVFGIKLVSDGEAGFAFENNKAIARYTGDDWLSVVMEQVSTGTWSITVTNEAGEVLHNVTRVRSTAFTSGLSAHDSLNSLVFAQDKGSINVFPNATTDNDAVLYITEVLGYTGEKMDVPAVNSMTLLDANGNVDTVLDTGAYTVLDSVPADVVTPVGFDTVMGFTKELNANTNNSSFKGIQIGNYKELWFGVKVVGGRITACLNYNASTQYYVDFGTDANGWVYIHMTQHEELINSKPVWTIEVLGSKSLILDDQQPVQYNSLAKILLDRPANSVTTGMEKFGTDDDTFMIRKDATAGTMTVYITEIRALKKDGTGVAPGVDTPDTSIASEIPANAVSIADHTWRSYDAYPYNIDKTTTVEGFDKVWKGTGTHWGSGAQGAYLFTLDETIDITKYSDLYLATRYDATTPGDAGDYIYLRGSSAGWYYGTDWLYLHFTQKSEGVWSFTAKAANGYNGTSNIDISAKNFKQLLSNVYTCRINKDTKPAIYWTNVRGIYAGEYQDRILYSAIDGATKTSGISMPAGYNSVFAYEGYTADSFAAVDLSMYETVSFGMLTSGNLVFAKNATNYAYFMKHNGVTVSNVAHTFSGITNAYINVNPAKEGNRGYEVVLTNKGNGNWDVRIDVTAYCYDPACDTSVCAELGTQTVVAIDDYTTTVTGKNTLQDIMKAIFNPAAGMTIYCTEVRGTHTCVYNNVVNLGNGWVQDACACGAALEKRAYTEIREDAETVLDHIWQANGNNPHYPCKETTATVPAGFSYIVEDDWNSHHASATSQYTYTMNKTFDITPYSELFMAVKLENGTHIYVKGNNGKGHYAGGDWLYLHFTQVGAGVWTFTASAADGYYVESTQQITASTMYDLLLGNVYGHRTDTSLNTKTYFTNVLGVIECDHVATEVSYKSNGNGTHNEICACTVELKKNVACTLGDADVAGNKECIYCGGKVESVVALNSAMYSKSDGYLVEAAADDVVAPAGFSSVTKYNNNSGWTSSTKEGVWAKDHNLSAYKNVYFALKLINARLHVMSGSGVSVGTDVATDWVYFHFSQNNDGTWEVIVTYKGKVQVTGTKQVGTTIRTLTYDKGFSSTDGQAFMLYQNNATNITLYSTEVRVEGFVDAAPACAEEVREFIWNDAKNTNGKITIKNDGAPMGFDTVLEHKWGNTSAGGANTAELCWAFDGSVDLSVYSDLYLAMKIENGTRFYMRTKAGVAGGVHYEPANWAENDWVYVHWYQEADATWSYVAWTDSGYYQKGTGFTGLYDANATYPTFKGLYSSNMYGVGSSADGTITYYTNVLGVKKNGGSHTASGYVSNGDGTHSSVCVCGAVLATTACGGEATCTEAAYCDVCKASYGSAKGHTTAMTDDGKLYCEICKKDLGELNTILTETQDVALFTNAAYATSGAVAPADATGTGFDALAETPANISLAKIANGLEIEGIANIKLNGVNYDGAFSLVENVLTINVIPYEVYGNYTLTATITVSGKTIDIEMPILVITNKITTNAGMLAMKYVLRGYAVDEEGNFVDKNKGELQSDGSYKITAQTEKYVVYRGGVGGDGTMNGKGYYKLGADIGLLNDGGSYTDVYVWGTYTVPFAGTLDGAGYSLKNYKKLNWFNGHLYEETASTASAQKEMEASLFGAMNGLIKNVAITNVNVSISTNIVLTGTGTFENVYFQLSDLNGYTSSSISPFFQRLDNGTAYFKNVVIDVTGAAITKGNPIWGALMESVTAYNVVVYGYNKNYTSGTTGYIYNDGNANVKGNGADKGVYVTYTDGTNNGERFWFAGLSNDIWKIVDGKAYLKGVNPDAAGSNPSNEALAGVGSEYSIFWNDIADGALAAAKFIDNKVNAAFTNESRLTVEAADLNDFSKKQIIVGDYEAYGKYVSWTDSDQADYGVYVNGNTIFVLAESEYTLMLAAQDLCRQLFNWNQFMYEKLDGADAYGITVDAISDIDVSLVKSFTSHVAFESRSVSNKSGNNGDLGFTGRSTYTAFVSMHNAANYFGVHMDDESNPKNASGEAIEGDYHKVLVAGGFEKGGENEWTYSNELTFATDSKGKVIPYSNSNSNPMQLCYTGHGNAEVFNAMVNRVAAIIETKKALAPSMTRVNFMVEDPVGSCACSTCASIGKSSTTQLLFINALKTKMNQMATLKDVEVMFFAYNNYSDAPVLTTTQYNSLKSLATSFGLSEETYQTVEVEYDPFLGETEPAKASEMVLKAVDGLRLWFTTHEMNHSFEFNHRANAHRYLSMLAWIESIGAGNIDVYAYQVAFNNYFIPLNTWEYQIQYYQFLNSLGVTSHMYNQGNGENNANAQTGFAAFKKFIDSRAMRDVTVTFDQLKQEFFGYTVDASGNKTFHNNGYYGAAGDIMLTFFEELVAVMEGHKQGNAKEIVTLQGKKVGTSTTLTYTGTLGESKSGYIATWIQESDNKTWYVTRQGFFNGTYIWNTNHMLFEESGAKPATDIYVYGNKTQQQTLTDWYGYCTTALTKVDAGSIYARRIQVESLFPEYAYIAYHSSYTFSMFGTLDKVTMPSPTLGCASYQAFYEKANGLGLVKPSEFHTYAGTNGGRDDSKVELQGGMFGSSLYENMWRNWKITVS